MVAEDIRFTTKDGFLYAIALAWPADGVFRIESLAEGNPHEPRPIASVELLSGANPFEWEQADAALTIQSKGDAPCEAAYVFRVRFAD